MAPIAACSSHTQRWGPRPRSRARYSNSRPATARPQPGGRGGGGAGWPVAGQGLGPVAARAGRWWRPRPPPSRRTRLCRQSRVRESDGHVEHRCQAEGGGRPVSWVEGTPHSTSHSLLALLSSPRPASPAWSRAPPSPPHTHTHPPHQVAHLVASATPAESSVAQPRACVGARARECVCGVCVCGGGQKQGAGSVWRGARRGGGTYQPPLAGWQGARRTLSADSSEPRPSCPTRWAT